MIIERIRESMAEEIGPVRIRPKLSAQAAREVRRDTPLRQARTCYGHLAGVAGVYLMEQLLQRGWLAESQQQPAGERVAYDLTQRGSAALASRGIQISRPNAGARLAFGCLDWTERHQHLGGLLGRAITSRLETHGIIGRTGGTRVVAMRGSLEEWLGTNGWTG